jgi:hypothetical protein
MKHSLTGAGVVLAEAVAAEADRMQADLAAELLPTTATGRVFLRRMAVHAVRMERGVKHEEACLAERVAAALAAVDDRRRTEVEEVYAGLTTHPAATIAWLRTVPEGLDLLIRVWQGLLGDLSPPRPAWGDPHTRLATLLLAQDAAAAAQLDALGRALAGDVAGLDPDERPGDESAVRARVVTALSALLTEQVAQLQEELEGLDTTALDRERAAAADLALFDPSPEAERARRYEAASQRGFLRDLKEFRRVEAEAADRRVAGVNLDEFVDYDGSGSFFPAPEPAPTAPEPAPEPAAEETEGRADSHLNIPILPTFTRAAVTDDPVDGPGRMNGVVVSVRPPRRE